MTKAKTNEDKIAEALESATEARKLADVYRADGDEEKASEAEAQASEFQAEAERLGAPDRDTEHHQVLTTEAPATETTDADDPIAGTVDDPNVTDPYAHLRQGETTDEEEGDE